VFIGQESTSMWLITFIETVFSLGLFINACLFIPQILALYKVKNSQGFSLLTFAGFCLIQLFTILHGVIHLDYLLIVGFSLSLMTCGTLTLMILYYRRKSERSTY
jgi:MtN3 and saliva related transmembrane protein